MNKGLQVFLCALAIGVAHAKPGFLHGGVHSVAYAAPAVSVSNQYHAQDTLGQYSYGYSGGPSAKAESKTADGVTRGGYSYVDSYGIVQSANYVADPVNGFRVAATNIPVHVPAPVHDTPEVVAAKAAHAVAYNEAAAAAAAVPDVPEPVAVYAAAAPAVYAAAAPAVYAAPAAYAAAAPAVHVAAAPAVYAAAAPAVVASHSYAAPGIQASANSAGGFAYSTQSVGPAYAPRYYSAAVPAAVHAVPAAVHAVPAAVHAVPAAVHAVPAVHAYAAAPLPINGVPVDTPEVAAAKVAHYAAHVEEKARHFG